MMDLRRVLVASLAAAAVVIAAALFGLLEGVELGALNRLFELRGPRAPATPIVIVAIDEDSFDELDLAWPFPRALHAALLDVISADDPALIGIDLLFSEPSSRGAADDEALGEAVARAGNVVLAAATTTVEESFYTKRDLNLPVPVIRDGAAAVGPVNQNFDADGVVRRVIPHHRVGNELVPGFDAQLRRLAAAAGLPAAPLPRAHEILINFRGGPRTFPWVPYHRIVRGEAPLGFFRGTIVLIGATSPVLQDVFSTPFARARGMPGVEIHANALETLLRGTAVREVPRPVSYGLALLVALAAGWLAGHLRPLPSLAITCLLVATLAAGTVAAFAALNTWIRMAAPIVALTLAHAIVVTDSYVREQREKRRLARFFSPAVLREVVRHQSDATLGSRRRVITVLFSDIRGFTSLSEQVQPEQVAEMLGDYLSEMTETVFRHGGTVDKYIGDCVMALFNAPLEDPDHAVNAVRAALDMAERVREVSKRWEAKIGTPIRSGIGINTGEAVVGAMGSRQRLEYTAIGDTVNLAARLESLTKEYRTPIIISESTREWVRGHVLTRELGTAAVRGKALPLRIYAVVARDMRQHGRAPLDVHATLRSEQGTEWAVRTRDVGLGGVAVVGLPSTWEPGSSVEVRCEGPDLPNAVSATATLVWRSDDAAGFAFRNADPHVASLVNDLSRARAPSA